MLMNSKKEDLLKLNQKKLLPSRIKESPINFECKVNEIINLGEAGGAGSLVLCEALKMHINTNVLDGDEMIDPLKLNIVSRLGGSWYGKTTLESIYKIAKPISKLGMDLTIYLNKLENLNSLTGNELAILVSQESTITKEKFILRENKKYKRKHILAKEFLSQGQIEKAWQIYYK